MGHYYWCGLDGCRSEKGRIMTTINSKHFSVVELIKRDPVWVIFTGCFLLFSMLSSEFLSVGNLLNILLQSSILGILAVGMTFLMISGYFDISIGSMMALTAAVAVSLTGYSVPLAILAALACGALFGAINGFFVTKGKINAFIVTLAAMVGIRGLLYVYTGEREIIGTVQAFEKIAAGEIFNIPVPILIWAAIVIACEWILRKTVYGRNVYGIGGNREATKNAGVPVDRYIFAFFMINGILVAIAGIILASRLNAATPVLGLGQEMIVIIAVVLGGTKLDGGYGNMIKTVAGVLTVGIIQNGMNILNVQTYYNMLIMGGIFILVVFMDAKLKPAAR